MQVIAGLCAGATATLVTHPLDVIKIRLQVGKPLQNMQLYRGIMPNLLGNTIAWGAYYGLYNYLQEQLNVYTHGPLLYWSSSLVAGVTTSFVTSPIWVVKTRILASSGKKYQKTWATICDIAKTNGLTGFWRAFPLSIAGTMQSSVHFMIYDTLKPYLRIESSPALGYLCTSAISKTIAATLFYPHQVVRSYMQFNNASFTYTVRTLTKERGLRGFYSGIMPALLRVVPSMCITQITYETVMRWG